MKKVVFVLITLFCFFLVGCNEKQDKEKLNSETVDNKINLESKNDYDKNSQEENSDEKEKIGKFYSLEDAYKVGILSLEDLEKIIDIANGNIEFSEEIDKEGENKIKKACLYHILNDYNIKDAKIDDVIIVNYYGNYNGAYAIKYKDIYSYPIGFREISVFVTVSSNPLRINCYKYHGELPIEIWSEKVYE